MREIPEALEVADGVEFCPQPYSYAAARLLREQHAEIERMKADNEALRRDAECYKRLRSRAKIYHGQVCFGDIRLPAPIPDRSPFDIIDEAVLADALTASTAPASAAVDASKQPATEPAIRARGEVPR